MQADDLSLAQWPAAVRNGAKTPETPTARSNEGTMLRAFQDAGYRRIGEAAGHDKSWVSRLFSGETRASVPELLCMFDAAGLRVLHDGAEKSDEEMLVALLHSTAASVRKCVGDAPEFGTVTLCAQEYRALLVLAQRQIQTMRDEHK